MALTTRDICTRALRKGGITSQHEAPEAEDFSEALDVLNDMLFAWKLAGVDTTHATLTGGSSFPLADEYVEGTVYLLASRLSPNYEMPARFDADDWFRKIQAAYLAISEVTMDAGLLDLPSQRHRRIF